MSQNLLSQVEKEVSLRVKGQSIGDAVNNAFSELRKVVYGMVPGPIVHMETTEFRIVEDNTKTHTEKFLWVLWPRQKQQVEIKAVIKVSIRYIRIDGAK